MATVPYALGGAAQTGALYPAVRGGLSGLLTTLLENRCGGTGWVLGIVFAHNRVNLSEARRDDSPRRHRGCVTARSAAAAWSPRWRSVLAV